jgi:hypothetical protein
MTGAVMAALVASIVVRSIFVCERCAHSGRSVRTSTRYFGKGRMRLSYPPPISEGGLLFIVRAKL